MGNEHSLRSWSTHKLKEIVENGYFCNDTGKDYGPMKEELTSAYYARLRKIDDKRTLKTIRKVNK